MAETNKVDESQRITVDSRGNWLYPSAAASGHIEIELPALPGNHTPVERLHARDFGAFVIGKVDSSMNRPGYLKTGPQQNPVQVLQHYVAVARGAQLTDAATLERMSEITKEFERSPNKEECYKRTVRPFLLGLAPKRRQP